MTAKTLLKRITEWAKSQPEVRAAVLTGSFARRDGTADEVSDLDVELFLKQPKALSQSSEWISEIDEVWICLPLQTDDGFPTRLVIFRGGQKADFTLYPIHVLKDRVRSGKLPDLYREGFHVLVDKEGLAVNLSQASSEPIRSPKPTEDEFHALVTEFWFEAYHVGKYLKREDLWAVKFRDWGVKELLRTMIEWHVKSRRGWSYTTHYLGVRMKEWVEPRIWERLPSVFGDFDAEDGWRALEETIDLFSTLAKEFAAQMHYRYPSDIERNLHPYIRSLRS